MEGHRSEYHPLSEDQQAMLEEVGFLFEFNSEPKQGDASVIAAAKEYVNIRIQSGNEPEFWFGGDGAKECKKKWADEGIDIRRIIMCFTQ